MTLKLYFVTESFKRFSPHRTVSFVVLGVPNPLTSFIALGIHHINLPAVVSDIAFCCVV